MWLQSESDAGRWWMLASACCGIVGLTVAACRATTASSGGGLETTGVPRSRSAVCVFPATEVKVSFQAPGGLWLEGSATYPERRADEKLPAVVLTHPAGVQSRDGVATGQWGLPFGFELAAHRELAQALTERGFVVLRYDKRNCGRFNACSENGYTPHAGPVYVHHLQGDMNAAIAAVARLPGVDGQNVHLFGHGESAAFVPGMLRRHPRLRSAVAFALDTRLLGDAYLERASRLERIGTDTGIPAAEVAQRVAATRAAGWDLLELAYFGVGGPAQVLGKHDAFWVDAIQAGLRDASPYQWSREKPLLLVYGEADWTVEPRHLESLNKSITRSKANATAITLPCITHALNCITEQEPSRIEAQHIGRHVDPTLINVVAQHFESTAALRTAGKSEAPLHPCQPSWAGEPFELAYDGPARLIGRSSCLRDRGCPTQPIPFCAPGLTPKPRSQWPEDGQRVTYAARLGVQHGGVTEMACDIGDCCNSSSGMLDLRESIREPGIYFELPGDVGSLCRGDDSGMCCPVPPHTKDGGGLVLATGIVGRGGLVGVELCRPRPEHYSHILDFRRDHLPLKDSADAADPPDVIPR